MVRLPLLPPAGQSWLSNRFAGYAACGETRLPVCQDCGAWQYPPRDICRHCFGDAPEWRSVALQGHVVAVSAFDHSLNDFYRRPSCPLALTVALSGDGFGYRPGAGAALAWSAEENFNAGDPVCLRAVLDRGGHAILIAHRPERAFTAIPLAEVLMDPNRIIKGKTVCITGAAGGIGEALVAAFAQAGVGTILACARQAAQNSASDTRIIPLALDVTDPQAISRLAADYDVDILINNAGVNRHTGFLSAPDTAAARAEWEVNFMAPLMLTRALAPRFMAKGRGVVVNMLSILAHAGLPEMASYCASKSAALALTEGLRAELRRYGVRVIGIFPGAVDTAMSSEAPPPKLAPNRVAAATLSAIEQGLESAYVGGMAQEMITRIRQDRDAFVAELAATLPDPR